MTQRKVLPIEKTVWLSFLQLKLAEFGVNTQVIEDFFLHFYELSSTSE